MFKRIRYVVKTLKIFSNIQTKARKQRLININLQFIKKDFYNIK